MKMNGERIAVRSLVFSPRYKLPYLFRASGLANLLKRSCRKNRAKAKRAMSEAKIVDANTEWKSSLDVSNVKF